MAEQIQTDVESELIDLVNRMRSLESRYELLAEKLLVVNQNMINEYKKVAQEIRAVKTEMSILREGLGELKNILKHLTEEAGMFARKEELKALEKYINMWSPLKFVTESDVKRIVSEIKVKARQGKTKRK